MEADKEIMVEEKVIELNPVEEKKERKANSWVSHVKTYAEKKKMPYKKALSDERCKKQYARTKKRKNKTV